MSRTTRFIDTIGNGLNRLTALLVALAIIAVVALVLWFMHQSKDDYVLFSVDDSIDTTPTIVEKMRSIGQWEFLTLSDEELVDTVRNGFFSDDELVRIYYGTLRIGVDFRNCSKEWVGHEGDTIVVTLPKMKLLDMNFIDEARTKSFFETGKWSEKDRKDLYDRAKRRMMQRCLNPENIQTAYDNACVQVSRMLEPIASPRALKVK